MLLVMEYLNNAVAPVPELTGIFAVRVPATGLQ